jgi:hypothetical protein
MIFYSKRLTAFGSYDATSIGAFNGKSNARVYNGINRVQIFPSWSHLYQISIHLRGNFRGLPFDFLARPNPGLTCAWTLLE